MIPTSEISQELSTVCKQKCFSEKESFAVACDVNVLEQRAKNLAAAGRVRDAMAIYLFMADGDPSLDAGYLAMRIGECCERLTDLHAAKWWYGRAVEENPTIPACIEARRRLGAVGIDALLCSD